ncbi:hypothetical protein [Nonomuraea salmonea]|uniref:hypothetical protein n=1 Tax=Nonomuraea salmonea TaxID=46181 RepID=UPI0031ED7C0C
MNSVPAGRLVALVAAGVALALAAAALTLVLADVATTSTDPAYGGDGSPQRRPAARARAGTAAPRSPDGRRPPRTPSTRPAGSRT